MIVALAVIAPALSLGVSELLRVRTDVAGRICLAGTTLGFTVAVGLVGLALTQSGTGAPGGWLSLQSGRLPAAMLLLVLGVSTLVQAYALRNLTGVPEQGRFIRTTTLTSSAVALTVTAAHLLLLLVGWELTTLGLMAIVGQRYEQPLAREGLRRALRSLLIGDAALLLAGALIWRSAGDASLAHLHQVAIALAHTQLPVLHLGLPAGPCVAVLLVIAASARAAQLPGQSWLAATLTTPTPASAMLHAGVVNAGGFLLVRLAPVFADGPAGPALAIVIGLATALYGGVLSLTRPDVKGGLAHSTSAQMGFMLIACGLGAYAAAILHLMGHGLYKATAFLSAEGAVATRIAKHAAPVLAPAARSQFAAVLLSGIVCAGAMAAALLSFAQGALQDPGAIVPVAFAWAAAVTVSAALMRSSHLGRTSVLALGALACFAYAGLLAGLSAYLRFTVATGMHPLPLAVTFPVIGAGFATVFALTLPAARVMQSLRLRLYPHLLDLGSVSVRPPARRLPFMRATGRATHPARLSERSATA